ncbi:MAG: nuclear transport factor 2 family protein [Acidobacteria bacterium]|nr:nuclear transport factor 2 family protein [Acidobacteriota bacterium]
MIRFVTALLATTVLAQAAAPTKAEQEVLDAMEAWRVATLAQDAPALDRLLHPQLIYSHSSGRLESKSDIVTLAKAKKLPNTSMTTLGGQTVMIFGPNAIVRGNMDVGSKAAGGSPTLLHLSVLYVWTRMPQGWQLVARQATKIAQ